MKNVLTLLLAVLVLSLISCKSAYEKQGDKHLEAGRYQKALQRYQYVIKKENGSKDFNVNLTKAYIGTFEKVAPMADIEGLDNYRKKITGMISGKVPPEVRTSYGKVAYKVGANLVVSGDYDSEDWGFKFLKDAQTYGSNAEKSAAQKLISDYIQKCISEAEDEYAASKNGEVEQGIVADYILSKAALFVTPTEEMNELWSKIRKANLSTYLMYDLQGLISKPVSAINKYGALLAVRAIARSGNSTSIQVQVYNGSTANLTFSSKGFTLQDKEGNTYEAKGGSGAFTKKPVEPGAETGVGQLRFSIPSDQEPGSIHFTSEAGTSVKWLP